MRFTKLKIYITTFAVVSGLILLIGGTSLAANSKSTTTTAICNSGAECIKKAETGDAKGFFDLLSNTITFLAIGVSILVVAMIIVGGIEYSASNGDPAKVSSAKAKISNAIFGFIAFLFLYAFLQWLVPGGIFS